MYGFSRDAQLQATVNTSYSSINICTLHDVMEITNGQQPCRSLAITLCFEEEPNVIAR
jgi:hypothetical protein